MEGDVEIRILVIDDDFFARCDLVGRLARHSRLRVVGDVATPDEALRLLRAPVRDAQPDVVLLDLAYEFPGFEPAAFIAELRALVADVKVLGMSVREDEALALDAIRSGVDGVVWKNEVRSRICRAVIRTHEGFCLFTPAVVRFLLGKIGQLPGEAEVIRAGGRQWLTPRLEQVARLWCEQGMGAREIAEELHLSEHTVRGYVKQVYQILGVSEDASPQSQRQRAYESRVDGGVEV